MSPPDSPPEPDDPLFQRLRHLRRDLLDDLTASRALARAEAAFAEPAPRQRSGRDRPLRAGLVPLALAAWGALYLWGAVGELRRLFPGGSPAAHAAAAGGAGPYFASAGVDRLR